MKLNYFFPKNLKIQTRLYFWSEPVHLRKAAAQRLVLDADHYEVQK